MKTLLLCLLVSGILAAVSAHARWRSQCPSGMTGGRYCSYRYRQCPYSYTCMRNRCCRWNMYNPPPCPNGQRPTTRCSGTGGCGAGYACTRGWCCTANTCPVGWTQSGSCDTNRPCTADYLCTKGNCCRPTISVTLTQSQCPIGQEQMPGYCDGGSGCPSTAYCHRNHVCCKGTGP